MYRKDGAIMSEPYDLAILKEIGDFEVEPFHGNIDASFVKLDLPSGDRKNISALLSQAPMAAMAQEMPNMWHMTFPDGLPHTLMSLNQGGYSSTFFNNGRIAGTASLHNLGPQAIFAGVFTAMAIASSQYFLTQINNELNMLNYQIDKILSFLYGDKKAELLSELKFVSYAYKNYSSIMRHEQQRVAIITGIYESRKVAMKDIEFYMQDLNYAIHSDMKNEAQANDVIKNVIQIKDSLDLSLQLYTMCSILETHYAMNDDPCYIQNVEDDLISYSDKCRDRMLDCFGTLNGRIDKFKSKKPDKLEFSSKISEIIDDIHNNEASINRKKISDMLSTVNAKKTYVLSTNGDIYCKI